MSRRLQGYPQKNGFKRVFSPILAFLNAFSRNESGQFFPNLTLFSCVSPSSVTYEGVAHFALSRLVSMLAPIAPRRQSHTGVGSVTQSRRLEWVTGAPKRPTLALSHLPPLFLLPPIVDGSSIGDSGFLPSIRSPWCPKLPL
jgi:hypothetical protein